MLRRGLLAIALCLMAYFVSMAFVPESPEPPLLKLRLADFDPSKMDSLQLPEELLMDSYAPETEGLYIVQFSGPIEPAQRQALIDAGATVIDYLPDFAYLVFMSEDNWRVVSQWPKTGLFETAWAGLYQPAFRISPELFKSTVDCDEVVITIQQYGETEDTLRSLSEMVLSGDSQAEVLAESIHSTTQRLRVSVSCEDLYQLVTEVSRRPNVLWIEPYREPVIVNDLSRWICQSYTYNYTPIWDQGIHGEGQIVGVCDTGLDADMCFFYDQSQGLPGSTVNNNQRKTIVYYDLAGNGDWDAHSHGTHCAGSIAGDNSANL
ncbi:MAG: S8 family serine peptidase, partial [Candidatus Coatesbacteria bacterium]|nr:S8 family serine peptidase [Candidatus Coatesbacteria bacterium]